MPPCRKTAKPNHREKVQIHGYTETGEFIWEGPVGEGMKPEDEMEKVEEGYIAIMKVWMKPGQDLWYTDENGVQRMSTITRIWESKKKSKPSDRKPKYKLTVHPLLASKDISAEVLKTAHEKKLLETMTDHEILLSDEEITIDGDSVAGPAYANPWNEFSKYAKPMLIPWWYQRACWDNKEKRITKFWISPCCNQIYDPAGNEQRWCDTCVDWFCTTCGGGDAPEVKLANEEIEDMNDIQAILKKSLEMPVWRGGIDEADDEFSLGGSGYVQAQVKEWWGGKNIDIIPYIAKTKFKWYKCKGCGNL
ncbi:hypothetical protein CPC08DRAFT_711446, partial [Agrocybe pediades]